MVVEGLSRHHSVIFISSISGVWVPVLLSSFLWICAFIAVLFLPWVLLVVACLTVFSYGVPCFFCFCHISHQGSVFFVLFFFALLFNSFDPFLCFIQTCLSHSHARTQVSTRCRHRRWGSWWVFSVETLWSLSADVVFLWSQSISTDAKHKCESRWAQRRTRRWPSLATAPFSFSHVISLHSLFLFYFKLHLSKMGSLKLGYINEQNAKLS